MKLLSDGPDLHYLVRLDPDQVCARLADEIGSFDGDFTGHVDRRTFRLRRNAGGQNAFRPYLTGRIEPALEGSRVVVRLGLHPSTKFFMVAWLGGMLLIGLVVLVLFLTNHLEATRHGPSPRKILLAPPAMFAGCIVAAWIGRLLGRVEESGLTEFADRQWGPRVDPAVDPE